MVSRYSLRRLSRTAVLIVAGISTIILICLPLINPQTIINRCLSCTVTLDDWKILQANGVVDFAPWKLSYRMRVTGPKGYYLAKIYPWAGEGDSGSIVVDKHGSLTIHMEYDELEFRPKSNR